MNKLKSARKIVKKNICEKLCLISSIDYILGSNVSFINFFKIKMTYYRTIFVLILKRIESYLSSLDQCVDATLLMNCSQIVARCIFN